MGTEATILMYECHLIFEESNFPSLTKYRNNQQKRSTIGYETQPALAPASIKVNSKRINIANKIYLNHTDLITKNKTNINGVTINKYSESHPLFINVDDKTFQVTDWLYHLSETTL